jgi:hypothetical protein
MVMRHRVIHFLFFALGIRDLWLIVLALDALMPLSRGESMIVFKHIRLCLRIARIIPTVFAISLANELRINILSTFDRVRSLIASTSHRRFPPTRCNAPDQSGQG